jgi:hypothetical protein
MHDPSLSSEVCSNTRNLPVTSKTDDVESIRYTSDANAWTVAFQLAVANSI